MTANTLTPGGRTRRHWPIGEPTEPTEKLLRACDRRSGRTADLENGTHDRVCSGGGHREAARGTSEQERSNDCSYERDFQGRAFQLTYLRATYKTPIAIINRNKIGM